MTTKNTKVTVPKEYGDGEILVSYGGDEPVTYRVSDGTATVPNEDVDKFLRGVPGSSVEGGSTDAGTTGDGQ